MYSINVILLLSLMWPLSVHFASSALATGWLLFSHEQTGDGPLSQELYLPLSSTFLPAFTEVCRFKQTMPQQHRYHTLLGEHWEESCTHREGGYQQDWTVRWANIEQ
jgi:hypothetical protein